ncbi:MAG: metallophosphoesterase [Candidatus Wallbacteria bacterium]|nr:metallophosphoesterase [Candidatus Wallbacteria bacterium]
MNLILLITVLILICCSELYFCIYFSLLKFKHKKIPLNRKYIKVMHWLFFISILCILYGYFIEPYWIEVTHITIRSPKLKNGSLRIVHLSDFHSSDGVRNEGKLPGIINPLKPDLLVFTGDAVISKAGIPVFCRAMSSLEAGIGKFAVLGNTDALNSLKNRIFENTGFKVLNGDKVAFEKGGTSFIITGLQSFYPHVTETNVFQQYPILHDLKPSSYNILLLHSPDLFNTLDCGIDLFLAGHTHGGQVSLLLTGSLFSHSKYGYISGEYSKNDALLYVNRGLGVEKGGWHGARFLCRPEVTVIDIVPQEQ